MIYAANYNVVLTNIFITYVLGVDIDMCEVYKYYLCKSREDTRKIRNKNSKYPIKEELDDYSHNKIL